ncbi:hypothetical protein [Streptomyces sp. NPDC090298]|uniref:hypothetical protein n=1 Tax=Streptomyces sp. NPDC090298 TaxID=3365959 RepID=UPI003825B58E
MDEREFVEQVAARPGMYGLNGGFYPTVTFLIGYDLGRGGTLLSGFTEWLIAKRGRESSLGWISLVLESSFPGLEIRHWSSLAREQESYAVDCLFSLLIDYLHQGDPAG